MIVRHPPYLASEDLPVIQTLVSKSISQNIPQLAAMAGIISEYVTNLMNVDTELMTKFFCESIPELWMEATKQHYPDLLTCLERTPPAVAPEIPRRSRRLIDSPERKLVALAAIFFSYRKHLFYQELSPEHRVSLKKSNAEYHAFLGKILGNSIFQICDPNTDKRLGAMYVFGHLDWYKQLASKEILRESPQRGISFLVSQGYTRAAQPAAGQVVIYHSVKKIRHFARVLAVDESGVVTAISKLSLKDVIKHRLENIPFYCGNSVTFLNPPPKVRRATAYEELD